MAFSKNLPHPGANQGNLRENPLTTISDNPFEERREAWLH